MKLATIILEGTTGVGLVHGDSVIPIWRERPELPRDMIGLIGLWDQAIADDIAGLRSDAAVSMEKVELLAPVPRPGKVLAIGLNYADHILESRMETPSRQLWFSKQPTCVTGPMSGVEIPAVSTAIDYEVEMVAVIGKGGRSIPVEKASEAVFGYCVGNDVTVRDWQHASPQWMLGKSFDTHAPFGPALTTADAIGDPHRLDIRCFVNGELRQSSNTRHLVFNLWEQVAHLSQAMTLEPGDVIFTGTPGGVGWAKEPKLVLEEGDIVRCEINELGAIENRMIAQPG